MDTRIYSLPNAPLSLDPDSYLEVLVPDVSSATGYTSCKVKPAGIATPIPILPIHEVAWGDGTDPYTSSGNFKYINGAVTVVGLNQSSVDKVADFKDSLNNPLFRVFNDGYVKVGLGGNTLGSYVGVPSIGALFMGGLTPSVSNYALAGTGAGATYLNGDSLSYSINGSVKGITNTSYTQFTQPFAVGSIAPTGANAFVVGGETFMKGSGSTSGTYTLRALNSLNANNFIVRDDGVCGFGTTGAGAARIEVVGGAFQGAYIQTSGSIGVNAVDDTGYAVKGQTDSGTAIRGNVTTLGGIGIEIGNTVTAASLFKVLGNGAASFGGTLDGETSGNNNMAYVATNGGYRVGYYGQTGYNTIQDFYTNGVKNTQIYEGTGYYALSAKNRWSVKTFNDNKSHLWMDGSTGYIGIGENYFAPSTMLHVGNVANTAIRNDSNAGGAYTGKKFEVEVGGGQWGWGYSAANNALTMLTTGSSTGNFIFGYGTEASPTPRFYYSSTYGGMAINVALGSINAVSHLKMFSAGNPTDNIILAETFGGVKNFRVQNDGYVIQKALDGAIANGTLGASEMSSYIDEAGNNLIFKVKYADGVTVKTATLPLV